MKMDLTELKWGGRGVCHSHFSLCLQFRFYDNCMIFALWSSGLQHHVVLAGILQHVGKCTVSIFFPLR
jgi:hypothetical protein